MREAAVLLTTSLALSAVACGRGTSSNPSGHSASACEDLTGQGDVFTITISDFAFHLVCKYHSNMTGQVTVR